MNSPRRIVIVGGGFAGTTVARALDRTLPADCELVVISEESYTTFHPLLPEALGASIFPEQAVAPIREMLVRGRFIMGKVTAIDAGARCVVCSTLAGERRIGYDELVLAFGSRARLDLIPGLAEHALPLKTVGDAMHIRNVVLRRIARIELETDAALRRRLGHFVVIGGGFSGVETAGELIDCLRSIRRYYPRVAADELRVTLLQDQPRLLLELSERLGRSAERSLARRGADVRTGARAVGVTDDAVTLAEGGVLDTATVICTIGTRPNALIEALGLPSERGRVLVDGDLSVKGRPGLWALGDCAAVPNAIDGKIAPPTAQFAVREAHTLADNLRAALDGKRPRTFAYASRGQMAAIGHRKGVADVLGLPLSGLPAWLAWRAYYLSQMPTLGRKLRIFVEWTWGMFFPNDITHLRFTRSADLADPAGSTSLRREPADENVDDVGAVRRFQPVLAQGAGERGTRDRHVV
jgi:NADH:quinone reductase (non-electrogenic)